MAETWRYVHTVPRLLQTFKKSRLTSPSNVYRPCI